MPSVSLRPVNPGPVIFSFYSIGLAFIALGWLNRSVGQSIFGCFMVIVGVYYGIAWQRAKRKDAEARHEGDSLPGNVDDQPQYHGNERCDD
jgi:hypothetical protein